MPSSQKRLPVLFALLGVLVVMIIWQVMPKKQTATVPVIVPYKAPPISEDTKENEAEPPPGTIYYDDVYLAADTPPSFPGGDKAFERFVSRKMKNPTKIKDYTLMNFVVNRNGSLSDISSDKRLSPAANREAIRIMKMSPRWRPARYKGEAVRMMVQEVVYFK